MNMTPNKHIEEKVRKFTELGIYTSEEQEPIEDYLQGKAFWDSNGNIRDYL